MSFATCSLASVHEAAHGEDLVGEAFQLGQDFLGSRMYSTTTAQGSILEVAVHARTRHKGVGTYIQSTAYTPHRLVVLTARRINGWLCIETGRLLP